MKLLAKVRRVIAVSFCEDCAQTLKRQALTAAVVRIFAAALSFGLMAVVARSVTVDDFGDFSVLLALVNIAVVFALLGHETLATRNIGAISFCSTENGEKVCQYVRKISRDALCLGVFFAGLVAIFPINPVSDSAESEILGSLVLLIPAIALIRINQGLIRGAHQPVRALLPDGIVRPGCALLLFQVFLYLGCEAKLSLSAAMLISALAAILLSYVYSHSALAILFRCLPKDNCRPDTEPELRYFSSAIFCSSIVAVMASQVGLVLLGELADATEAASYSVAQRYSIATSLIAQGVYQAVSSRIAAKYSSGDLNELQILTGRICRFATAGSLLCAFGIALGSAPLLGLFGDEYRNAATVLYVLLLGIVVNVAAGPVGILLLMTGNEDKHLSSLVISLVVQVLMLVLLVQKFGALGAAFSALVSTIIWNSIMAVHVQRSLGFRLVLLFA